jgi:superfamily I DNA/RNA helicase
METLRSLNNPMNACLTNRQFGVNSPLSETAKNAGKLDQKIRTWIFKMIRKEMTKAELKEECLHAYDEDPSVVDYAKINKGTTLYECLCRYFDSEQRFDQMEECPETVIDIYGVTVDIKPDVLVKNGDKIEVIKYFFAKPKGFSEVSMSLYALLYYGKEYAAAEYSGKNIHVTASFYYLRQKTDKKNALDPGASVFNLDFFAKEGKNVVSMADYNLGQVADETQRVTQLDTEYYGKFVAFAKGAQMNFSEEKCRYCTMNAVCSYNKIKNPLPCAPGGNTATVYNEDQKKILAHREGLARVIAAAGTGKTATMTGYIAERLKEGVEPEKILAITFTNAAAKELTYRVAKICEENGIDEEVAKRVVIRTFNGLGQDLLNENYQVFGYAKEPEPIIPSKASEIIEHLLLEEKVDGIDYDNLKVDELYLKGGIVVTKAVFDVFKRYQIKWNELDRKADFVIEKCEAVSDSLNESLVKNLYPLYMRYEQELKNECLNEYADQEMAYSELEKRVPGYFAEHGFEYIIVDEFQDSNVRQMGILKLLLTYKGLKAMVVVGDDAQAIYGFLDSSPENIINFFGLMGQNGKDYYLTKNYRSAKSIIDLANRIHNLNRFKIPKMMSPMSDAEGKVTITAYSRKEEEYRHIASEIKKKISAGEKPENIAVIAFTKSELLKIQEYLIAEGIDSSLLVPENVMENSRVKAILGLYSSLTEEGDEKGVVAYLSACVDGKYMALTEKQRTDFISQHLSYAEAFREFTPEEKLAQFKAQVERIPGKDIDEVYTSFVEQVERAKTWSAISNLIYCFSVYGGKDTVSKVLSYPGVALTTAHSSKGLEWKIVYNTITKYDGKQLRQDAAKMEERRRLLFVSATRAREELYISGQYYAFGTMADAKSPDEKRNFNLHYLMKELYVVSNRSLQDNLKKSA